MLTICTNVDCRREFSIERRMKERPDPERGGVFDIGFQCPGCGHWTHTHFESNSLRAMRNRLQQAFFLYQKRKGVKLYNKWKGLQDEYRAAFEVLNPPKAPLVPERWRKKDPEPAAAVEAAP